MLTFVLSLGQLIKSDIDKTIAALAELSSQEIINELSKTCQPIIDDFNCGKISEKDFFTILHRYLGKFGKCPSQDEVIDAWNKMSQLSATVIEDLSKLAIMQSKQRFNITVIGCTNATQHRYIHQQLKKNGISLSLNEVLSFEEGVLSPAHLFKKAKLDRPGTRVFCMMDVMPPGFKCHKQVKLTAQDCLHEVIQCHLLADQSFLPLTKGPSQLVDTQELSFPRLQQDGEAALMELTDPFKASPD